MKIVIDIPKEFESHFERDRFDESLCRLHTDAHCVAGKYEKELCDMLIESFNNSTPLPKGHGRLIDADETLAKAWTNFYAHEDEWQKKDPDYLLMGRFYNQKGFECCQQTIVKAPTIIKADKEGKE